MLRLIQQNSPDNTKALESINRFVVVPIDKATSNVVLTCKQFYVSVIANEVGLVFELQLMQNLKLHILAWSG